MSYVDGFVIPVPTANRPAFFDQARGFDTALAQFGAARCAACNVVIATDPQGARFGIVGSEGE